jgi:pimeloyl-ACP methyl ester carboxylesterase
MSRFPVIAFYNFIAVMSLTVASAQVEPKPPAPPMPGRLIATDAGHRLHLWCTGGGPAPTVILVGGGGGYSVDWALTQPGIAANARVCSYDRAGFAWSDKGPTPRGVNVSADELHQVLRRGDVPQPYVLVGLSLGGMIVRVYAHKYSDEVAGVVLIDSTLEDGTAPVAQDVLSRLDTQADEESNPAVHLPPEMRAARTWATSMARQEEPPPTIRDGAVELETNTMTWSLPIWLETSDLQEPQLAIKATMTRSTVPLGDKPLFVISAGRLSWDAQARAAGASYMDALRSHIANQAYAAGLSRNSRFVVARESFHAVIFYEPQLVTSAILEVVASARTGDRLKPLQ